MIGLRGWDPLSGELLVDTLWLQYGWVLALALWLGVRCRARWQHLPVLCWALISARHHLEFWEASIYCQGPSTWSYWVMGYQNMLGLCAVCGVQVVGLSIAGRPAGSLGTTSFRRLAMISALAAVTMDMFVFLWAVSPHPGVQYF